MDSAFGDLARGRWRRTCWRRGRLSGCGGQPMARTAACTTSSIEPHTDTDKSTRLCEEDIIEGQRMQLPV